MQNGLPVSEVNAIIIQMSKSSTKDVIAGIKASNKRKYNVRARKAWATRRAK